MGALEGAVTNKEGLMDSWVSGEATRVRLQIEAQEAAMVLKRNDFNSKKGQMKTAEDALMAANRAIKQNRDNSLIDGLQATLVSA